jgi:hypothetical protein
VKLAMESGFVSDDIWADEVAPELIKIDEYVTSRRLR